MENEKDGAEILPARSAAASCGAVKENVGSAGELSELVSERSELAPDWLPKTALENAPGDASGGAEKLKVGGGLDSALFRAARVPWTSASDMLW